jgi:hypothetical protein
MAAGSYPNVRPASSGTPLAGVRDEGQPVPADLEAFFERFAQLRRSLEERRPPPPRRRIAVVVHAGRVLDLADEPEPFRLFAADAEPHLHGPEVLVAEGVLDLRFDLGAGVGSWATIGFSTMSTRLADGRAGRRSRARLRF